jgi:hypothetical protein
MFSCDLAHACVPASTPVTVLLAQLRNTYNGVHGHGPDNPTFAITASLRNEPQQFIRLVPGISTFSYVAASKYMCVYVCV